MKKKIIFASLSFVSLSTLADEPYQMGGYPSRYGAPNIEFSEECNLQLGSVTRRKRDFRTNQDVDLSNTPDMQPLAKPKDSETQKQMGDNHSESDGQFQ